MSPKELESKLALKRLAKEKAELAFILYDAFITEGFNNAEGMQLTIYYLEKLGGFTNADMETLNN